METKKLMILGASQLQLPAIIRAKEMGLHVIALDQRRDAVGVTHADEFYEISTVDTESIVRKATELNIDGIMTLATDMPMRSVAAVGERLGLHTISYETAIRATNKARMRESFLNCGISVPQFSVVRTYDDFQRVVRTLGGDLIVKPVDSSGSRGVRLMRSGDELETTYEYSKGFSNTGEIIVEEYMEGPEVSVETITVNGMTHVIAITDKVTTGPPHFVETGHSVDSLLPDTVKNTVVEIAKNAISAIGIDNGPAHTEIIITEQGPKVVELGARLGGDNITSLLVPLATGVDMVKACIDLAIGNEPDLGRKCNRGSAIRYFSSGEGLLSGVDGIDEARGLIGIYEVCIWKTKGDKLNQPQSSVDRVGHVISHANSVEEAIRLCEQALEKIRIRTEQDGKGESHERHLDH